MNMLFFFFTYEYVYTLLPSIHAAATNDYDVYLLFVLFVFEVHICTTYVYCIPLYFFNNFKSFAGLQFQFDIPWQCMVVVLQNSKITYKKYKYKIKEAKKKKIKKRKKNLSNISLNTNFESLKNEKGFSPKFMWLLLYVVLHEHIIWS